MINQDSIYRVAIVASALTGTTAVTGTALDRNTLNLQEESLELVCVVDGITGSGGSFTATFTLQDSPDNSTWTAVSGANVIAYTYKAGTVTAAATLATTDASGNVSIALTGTSLAAGSEEIGVIAIDARGLNRYLQAIVTPAFTGSVTGCEAHAMFHLSRLSEIGTV